MHTYRLNSFCSRCTCGGGLPLTVPFVVLLRGREGGRDEGGGDRDEAAPAGGSDAGDKGTVEGEGAEGECADEGEVAAGYSRRSASQAGDSLSKSGAGGE